MKVTQKLELINKLSTELTKRYAESEIVYFIMSLVLNRYINVILISMMIIH